MIKSSKALKSLIINILIFLSYSFLCERLSLCISFFYSLHLLFIFAILKKYVSRSIPIRKLSILFVFLVLSESIILFLNGLHIKHVSCDAIFIVLVFKSVVNICFFVIVFSELIDILRRKYGILIFLEIALSIILISIFSLYSVLPIQLFYENMTSLDYVYLITSIIDSALLILVFSISLFIFKYQEKYTVGYLYPLITGLVVLFYIISNMYFVSGNIRFYNITLVCFMFSLFLYVYKIIEFSYSLVPELIDVDTINYNIEIAKNSNVAYGVFIVPTFIFVLFLIGGISLEVYAYLLFMLLLYMILSLEANRLIIRRLIEQRKENSKEKINESIRYRNEELLRINAKLKYLASHDKFTNLPNRSSFIKEVGNLIEKEKVAFSFVLINLQNIQIFKNLYGAEKSRKLILCFVERLKTYLSNTDYIYQISAYEIAVISLRKSASRSIDGIDNITFDLNDKKEDFFEYFYNSLSYIADKEYEIDDITFGLRLKLSFVDYPNDVSSLRELFIISDLKSFEYKRDSELKEEMKGSEKSLKTLINRNRYSSMLKDADFDKEFLLYYQPQFDIKSKRIIACEALLRWKKDGEFISPALFIPIAETTGSIHSISKWVGKEAINQMQKWNYKFAKDFKIGINISSLILDSADFLNEFKSRVLISSVNYDNFDFEITEYTELDNSPELLYRLNEINQLGVSLSIDDFGTGYSSLSYIKMYNVNRIKIAKELIDEIEENEEYRYMVDGIVKMAKTLGMSTIAEGVETEKQLEILRDLDCDELQGYIWGKPMSASDFEELYMQINI